MPVFSSRVRSFNELPISLARRAQIQRLQNRGVIRNVSKQVVVSAGIVAQLTVDKNRPRYPLH